MRVDYKFIRFIFFIILIYLSGCITSHKRLNFKVDDIKQSVEVKQTFSFIELYHLFKCLELVKLIDPTQTYINYEHIPVYWMSSKKFAGLTVWNKDDELLGIFLDEDLKIKDYNDNFQYLNLGAIYSHELSHALHGTKDPYTSTITERKIYSIVATNNNVIKLIINWKPF
jgi:hypothetical protein